VKARAGAPAIVAVLAALALIGCKTAAPGAGNPGAAAPGTIPDTIEGLAAAIAADARHSDTETDSKTREQLAADASRDGDACLARSPQAAACLYYHGVALGLEARAHPLHAAELLKSMLDALAAAESADRRYDHGGAARVQALVLIKAPGWPLGPGDPDAGLLAARRAVEIEPDYAPNELALAEALAKTGDAGGAHRAYARAHELAEAAASPERDDWLSQAAQGLRATTP
jgi:hypothetical protein